ncbi:hypothetical protein AIOL_001709 [Candidatus Rhodobacter oscarellae]|uniref:Peptidoglycan binding-like domain-containing protein n=1 Tax=Candidatus Rhodobacter oscarellae TaxID=1675527 RepID=A0A0J9GTD7_9RHOB|nr:serine protease [Candidatus Rhodobacter lobularis]KMW56753.1 hypothetical protein AIOL_001709 [Candidatus Rhodobacter lobularis]
MKQFVAVLLLGVGLLGFGPAAAQSVFVQIEAHPNLPDAEDAVRDFASDLPDVNGFRFASGWYAVALGPYDLATAVARVNTLKSRRAIPADSYLVDGSTYSQQFYPIGASALTAPAVTAPAPTAPAAQVEVPALQGGTETAAAPEPEPEPLILEETRREALRSEGRLSRQDRFDLQIALQWFGFYEGRIDAAFGPGTRNSMARWQSSKGYDDTGVLTTRQRQELITDYTTVLASLNLQPWRDDSAGIEMELPTAMVAFDRYEPPFAHYNAINDSGVRVLLISQAGNENSLLGLYDIMQTLKIVPLEGERERRANRFTLTGENSEITSYTHAVLDNGEIKGFTLIWPVGEDKRREVALKAMRDSFTPVSGTVLPDVVGDGALEQSLDLVSGLEIRRPIASRSGFYVDGRGTILTSTAAVNGCQRITVDEIYDADVVARDAALGLALLRPKERLAPIEFARFQPSVPRLKSEVAVAGYSFEGALGSPTVTFGTLADVKGLRGERTMKRLALSTSPGDAGGPVFDATGSVMGMLLPNDTEGARQLPGDVNFATDSAAIAEFMSNNGISAAASDASTTASPEAITTRAQNLTVLVGCWDE